MGSMISGQRDWKSQRREPSADKGLMEVIERCRVAFREAMDDDFNTPVAIAELQRLKSDVNKLLSQGLSTEARKIAREEFRSLGECAGIVSARDSWQFEPERPHRSGRGEAETHLQEVATWLWSYYQRWQPMCYL